MQQAPDISPDLFWQTISGYQHTAVLKAAVELEMFTAIDNGAATAAEIANVTKASERGARITCDALTVMGFLTKTGDVYELTPSSATFLSKRSPAYIGTVVDFIASDHINRGFDTFTDAVKQGGSVVKGDASLDPESPMWVAFAHAMMPMMAMPAQMIADQLDYPSDRPIKVLDIAASHGIFGLSIAKKYPNAQVTGLDWKNVVAAAKENAEAFGIADRYHTIEGSAFDVDFGSDYDVVLLTNFLHHFDPDTCISLIRKCNEAIKPHGKLLTLEFVPNDDRVSPPREALFAPVMLAGTPLGDAYTFNELKDMFEKGGFSGNDHVPLPPTPQHLIVSTK